MKVKQEISQVSFLPYTLRIDITSPEEHAVMREIASSDIRIPNLLYRDKGDYDNADLAASMLFEIHRVIG